MVRGTAKNIQVYNPTTNTLNVRWDPAPGLVQQYKVNYSPLYATSPPLSVSIESFWLYSCIISLFSFNYDWCRNMSNCKEQYLKCEFKILWISPPEICNNFLGGEIFVRHTFV